MSAQANHETLGEFRARRDSEAWTARWESIRRWGLVALLVGIATLFCLASALAAVWYDRATRADVVVLEKKGDCQPKPLAEQLRDKLRRK